MRPARKFIHNITIGSDERNALILELTVAPVIVHALLEELDAWILVADTELINQLLEDSEAFADALFLRLLHIGTGHSSYQTPSLLFK